MPTLTFDKPVRQKDSQDNIFFLFRVATPVDENPYTVVWTPSEPFNLPEDVLNDVLEEFLSTSSQYFVRPPTLEHHKKSLLLEPESYKGTAPLSTVELVMYLSAVKVYSKSTVLCWASKEVRTTDAIPSDFLTEDDEVKNVLITSDPAQTAIMEAVADIPLQETHPFRLDDDAEERMYRLRVMEARLTAKLAAFKAQKEREKYYSKFGRLPPDAGSETEDDLDEDSDGTI